MSLIRANDSRIHVSNLPPNIRAIDIEKLFPAYAKVDMKYSGAQQFAFVEFRKMR